VRLASTENTPTPQTTDQLRVSQELPRL
jgi:hypothetical protein